MREKLKALGITTVVDVRNSRVAMLQHELGTKSGTLVRSISTIVLASCSLYLKCAGSSKATRLKMICGGRFGTMHTAGMKELWLHLSFGSLLVLR